MKDWLSRKPELVQRLLEAQYNNDESMAGEIEREVFAIMSFENYLRSIEVFGQQALDRVKGEQL